MTRRAETEVNRIKGIRKELEEKRKALLDIPVDDISEEEEDRLFKLYSDQIETTITAEYDAIVPEFRPNEWFKSFISSFGECKSKRISRKQSEIFSRYLPSAEQKNSFSSFHGKSFTVGCVYKGSYDGKIFESSCYGNHAYLSIREKATI